MTDLRKRTVKLPEPFNTQRSPLIWLMMETPSLLKTSVSPRSSPLGTFRVEECLQLSGKNSILMMQINVYIINPVVMGFQIYICPILRVFWLILVKCGVHLPTSSSKTQLLLLEKSICHKDDCFVRDSSRLHLTFVAFCLLSVICKQ